MLSAVLNVVVLAGIPLLAYGLFHRRRHRRSWAEIFRRAGLQLGEPRYLLYSLLFAAVSTAVLLTWPPALETFLHPKSPQRDFVGVGIGWVSIVLALLYGVVKTGFAEELLFRGLIAGSLGRRLKLWQANLLQALIFMLPHLAILLVMPEQWALLIRAFIGALFMGWVRIRSESILGPWLIHAILNTATCLYVAHATGS